MHKIFLSVATMIVTRFVMKVVDRIKNPPVPSREELYGDVLRKKHLYDELQREKRNYYEERSRAEPKVNVKLMSTPRSTEAWLANIATVDEFANKYKEFSSQFKEPCEGAAIGSVQQMHDALRSSNDQCDAMAMAMASGRFS